SMDEGWTRYVLEQLEIPFESIHNKDIQAGQLHQRFDAILIPDSTPGTIVQGYSARPTRGGERDLGQVPPEFAAGIGEEGVAQLTAFMEAGGHLITLNQACNLFTENFKLPVRNALSHVTDRNFYCPGSILRVEVDTAHPVAYGLDSEAIAWFEQSPAFEAIGGTPRGRFSYPTPAPSGSLVG